MKFVLKQHDTELISFDLRSEGLDGFACTSPLAMTDRQRKQLRELIDFRFTRDHNYDLPAKRLKDLERFLQRRTKSMMLSLDSKG